MAYFVLNLCYSDILVAARVVHSFEAYIFKANAIAMAARSASTDPGPKI